MLALFLVCVVVCVVVVVVVAPTGVVLRLLLRAIWVTPDLGSTQAILPEAN